MIDLLSALGEFAREAWSGFLRDWWLFRDAYLAGWAIALLLSLLGVLVVARDQIFLGAAMAQASTLGVATAFAFAELPSIAATGFLEGEGAPAIFAVGFSVLAALGTAAGGRRGAESHEAVTGWIFLVAASLSVLVAQSSPHGLEEVKALLFSTIIGARPFDVGLLGALALGAMVAVPLLRHRLLLLAVDPDMARAVGVAPWRWGPGVAVALGLAVGLSLSVAGLLYTFGCLVLPALAARNVVREATRMFIVAPVVGLAGSGLGFVLAHALDVPPAQMTVALLGGAVAASWGLRGLRGALRGALRSPRERGAHAASRGDG